MIDSSETRWFNQVLFSYADNNLNSNGTIKMLLSVNSKDLSSYNSPSLLLNISNQLSKSLSLRIEHIYDIVENFNLIYDLYLKNDSNIFGIEFERKYNRNTSLLLKIMKKVDTEEIIFRLMLQSGLNDLTYVDFRFRIFQAIFKIFKNFSDSYTNICFNLLNKQIDHINLEPIREIPITLKAMLSTMNRGASFVQPKIEEMSTEIINNTKETDKYVQELDHFLGKNMSNIKVAAIDEPKTKDIKPVISSKFITNGINYNLFNLKKFLFDNQESKNTVYLIHEFIKNVYGLDYNPLPGITDQEMRSTHYLSEIISKTYITQHKLKRTQIPYGTHVLFYKPDNITETHVDMAFDILLFMTYMKIFRTYMEDRTPDYIENGSLFYIQLRYFFGIYCYSFIKNQESSQLSNIIVSRFKDYSKVGVFTSFSQKLADFNCKPIHEVEILKVHNDFFDKFSNIEKTVIELHKELKENGSVVLDPIVEYNREQISNEIVPLEILKRCEEDLSSHKSLYSEDIFRLFYEEQPKKSIEDIKKEKTNLVRYIKDNRVRTPKKMYKRLIEELKDLGNKNYVFDFSKYSYVECEDEIIRALHIWKPLDDSKLTTNYVYFLKCCEDCLLDKHQILSLYDPNKSVIAANDSGGWGSIDPSTFVNLALEN
jgi:hypothetical protein